MTRRESHDFRRGSVKGFRIFCAIFILLCSGATLAEAQGVDLTVTITDVPDGTQNGAFSVTITFSEAVSGFEAADIATNDLATVTSLESTDDTVYIAEITPNEGAAGDVIFSVPENVAKPAAAALGTLDNNIASQEHTVPVDRVLPEVVPIPDLPTTPQKDEFSVTITFTEVVKDFAASDIIFSGDDPPATVKEVTADSSTTETIGDDDYTLTYTATITPTAGKEGDVTLEVVASAVTDAAGNANTAFTATDSVRIDTIPPTVAVSGLPDGEQKAAFDVTITFSEDVTGFGTDDISVSGEATATGISGSGKDYTATITPTAGKEDDITLHVAANGVEDNAGNGNTASVVTPQIHIDTILPTVASIVVPEDEENDAFDITLTFSEPVKDFEASDIELIFSNGDDAVATVTALTEDSSTTETIGGDAYTRTYTATITPTAGKEGDVTLEVVASAVTDAAGNANTTFTAADSVRIDTIPPTVAVSGLPDGEQKAAFDVTITFSEDVTGFDTDDISVSGEATATGISGSGKDYTATITPTDGKEGDVTLEVVASAVTDAAGNANTAFTATDSVRIDTIPPTVAVSDLPDGEQKAAFDVTITFSEDVTGFDTDDISVSGEATATGISGSGKDYTATITPTAGKEDDITLHVAANGVEDNAGNGNTASAVTPQIHIDTIPPTVASIVVPEDEENDAFDITLTFSEPVKDFEASDIELIFSNGDDAVATVTALTEDSSTTETIGGDAYTRTYTATITPTAGKEGDVTLEVVASAVTDAAGNANTAFTATDSVHVDTIAPTVEISGVPDIEKNVAFDLTITFSEEVNGFQVPADLTVTGPAEASLKSGAAGGAVYIVTITPADEKEGDVTVQVKAGAVQDIALNANTDASEVTDSVHVDTIAPTVAISGTPTTEQKDAFDLTITFSEAVNGFEVPADLTVTGPAGASLKSGTAGDTVYVVTITPDAAQEGDVTVQVKASAVQDAALNANTDASEVTPSVHVDTIAPTVVITGAPTTEQKDAFDLTITFSEAVNGFEVPDDLTVTGPAGASLKSGTAGGAVYVVTITPDAAQEGAVTVQVKASAVQDAALNANTDASEVTPSVHVDTIAPTVVITGAPTTEQKDAFDLTITFSEAVNDFEVPDDLTVTGPAGASLKSGDAGDTVYIVTITPDAAEEDDVTVQVKASAVQDAAQNDNTASNVADVHIDTIVPGVDAITGIPDIEKNSAFDITITFSEEVNDFQASGLTVTGPAGASLKSGDAGDTVYVVTITPDAAQEGDVTVQVKAGAVRDFALNDNTISEVTDSVHVDTIAPTVEISGVPDIEKNVAFDLTITFSEAVNGFEVPADLTVTGPAGASWESGAAGDTVYIVTITPAAAEEGDVTVQVKAGAVQDMALNANTDASEVTDSVHVDTIPPTVEITDVPTAIQLEAFSVAIIFSEVVNEFAAEDIQITGDAVVEGMTLSGSGNVYLLKILPDENTDGDIIIKVPEDVAEDEATNVNTPSSLQTVFVAPKWIPDPNLRTVVREELGLDEGEDFAPEQLEVLTTFDGFYRDINDLTGLEYATELSSAGFTGNFISDLIPLAGLTTLTTLLLDNNAIADIMPLEGLTDLTALNLAANRIADVTPLEALTALQTLNLSENLISDLDPLAGLTLLTHLYLTSNDIRDVSPLVDLENLEVLEIAGNPIQNVDLLVGLAKAVNAKEIVPSVIPDQMFASAVRRALKLGGTTAITIAELRHLTTLLVPPGDVSSLDGLEHATALTTLVLSDNSVTDITALQGLTELRTLNLSGNAIIDITPLEDLTALTTLNLDGNAIIDITPLEDLTELTALNLDGNAIIDIIPLEDLTELRTLNLSGNAIIDITPLEDFTELTILNLSGNSITDIAPLEDLTELIALNLSNNPITNFERLAGFTNLTVLELSGNAIGDLNPISGLTELTALNLSSNAISDVTPLRQLTQLTVLDLNDNAVDSVTPLAGLTNLTTLELADNTISVLNPITSLTRLRDLDVRSNTISDVRPLTALIQLTTLDLAFNDIRDVQPLAGSVSLARLRLEGNPILDTTPLYPLTQRLPPVDIDIVVSQYPPWDVNADGRVNAVDSALVTAALGQTGEAIVDSRTDVNGDGTVDNADLLIVTDHFDDDSAAPSVANLFAGVGSMNRGTLETALRQLIAESDGSLKYRRAIAFLESLLAGLSPHETRLLANYPNPFNPETWIPYQLANAGTVVITIYDTRGSVVHQLVLGHQQAGYYTEKTRAAYWDGRNHVGERVASGVYFYQLEAGNISLLRKMVILK